MDILSLTNEKFFKRLCSHISKIYGNDLAEETAEKTQKIFEDQKITDAEGYYD